MQKGSGVTCNLCRRRDWPWRGRFLGRHFVHSACMDDAFEAVWSAVHPLIHDGWNDAQLTAAIKASLVERGMSQ